MMRRLLVILIQIYRYTLSPLLSLIGGPGSGCRYHPTCSRYAIEALEVHGAALGSWLAVKRFCRCHPWGGFGFDPVPPRSFSCTPCDLSLPRSHPNPTLPGADN